MSETPATNAKKFVFLSNTLSILEATAGDKLTHLTESLHEVRQHSS